MKRCYSCFAQFEEHINQCPNCGKAWSDAPVEPIHLNPGTILAQRYILGTRIGSGGFGIIYGAWDTKLDTVVAIKELFIASLMTRAAGHKEVIINKKSKLEFEYRKDRFLAEARNMAKFASHKSILNVFDFFEENDTAYIVMERLEGNSLGRYLKDNNGKIDAGFAVHVTNEAANALITLHENGIVHRDVAPDNIYICSGKDIKIKLLDLGSAKLSESDDSVVDIVLKPGYSPPEQYDADEDVGPWMDVYALAATLYVMLTGVKPDESTNRKGKGNDKVLPPRAIDSSIDENISNAVMKGMAIEKHLRYKTVKEFLSAINGEKKAILPEKEVKLRKRRRFMGVTAACVLLGVGAVGVYSYYESKKTEQTLSEAAIEVWYAAQEDSNEVLAMESIKQDFESNFSVVTVELKRFDEAEYNQALEDAAANNTLPDLFESTDASQEVLDKALDVNGVLESEQAQDCLFIDQYNDYYSQSKKVPLAIEVPLAFYVTGGKTSVSYSKGTFGDVSDFGADVVSFDENAGAVNDKNYGDSLEGAKNRSAFVNNETAVMLSSSMQIENVSEELLGYEWDIAYLDAGDIYCDFTYEWSIGAQDNKEIAAAERMLSWMLGKPYQTTMMLAIYSDGGYIPINEACFTQKCEANHYSAMDGLKNNFRFKGN